MDKHRVEWNGKIAQHIIDNLEKRRMAGSYASTAAVALEQVLAMVPRGSVVYRCGSITTTCIGLWKKMATLPEVKIIDPFQPGLTPQESMAMRHKGLGADIMIAGCNAITMDGRLVNLDGVGNRTAALMFGPEKVILVAGINKVAPDMDSAIARVKHYAAPVNAIRLGQATPCAINGLCSDCRSPERVCNMWTVVEGQRIKDRIHVVLIGEDLGY